MTLASCSVCEVPSHIIPEEHIPKDILRTTFSCQRARLHGWARSNILAPYCSMRCPTSEGSGCCKAALCPVLTLDLHTSLVRRIPANVQYQQPPPGQQPQQQYPLQQYGGAPPLQYGHQPPPQYGHGYQSQGPPDQGQQPYYQNPYQPPPQQQGSYSNQVGRRKMLHQLHCLANVFVPLPAGSVICAGPSENA